MVMLEQRLREAEVVIRNTAEMVERLRAGDQRTRACLVRSLDAVAKLQRILVMYRKPLRVSDMHHGHSRTIPEHELKEA